MKQRTRFTFCVFLTVALVGCGGGGGGADAGNPAPAPNTATSVGAGAAVTGGTAPVAVTTAAATPASFDATEVDTTALSRQQNLPVGPNGHLASLGNYSASDKAKKLADGLAIWRAQRIDINGIDKGACANCHSADGIELAMWDFHDDDVRRRAHIDGVNATDREKLVEYFAALRQHYNITTVKSIQNDRPFQPKGRPFAGDTKAQRDLAFANESLKAVAPTLYNGAINNAADAKKARKELADSNPLDIQIGIPLPRMSEDCFRGGNVIGSSHCSPNDWMADTPRIPMPAKEAEWFKINDDYIANPTDTNLRKVLIAADTMTLPWKNPGQTAPGAAASLGTRKFKSMQILQHQLRRQQLGLFNPATDQNPLLAVGGAQQSQPNAPFLVGDTAFNKDSPLWKTPDDMPVFVRRSLGENAGGPLLTNADVEAFKADMFTPWWYVGFTFDAHLETGTHTEYFFGSLALDPTAGYPFHRYYVIGKHGAISSAKERTSNPAQVANYNVALSKAGWKEVGSDDVPRIYASADARQLYRKLEMSWTLMWMYLVKEQLQVSGKASFDTFFDINMNVCGDPDNKTTPDAGNSLRRWVTTVSGLDGARAAQAFNLFNDINTLADCKLPAFPTTYVSGAGTGLTVEWFKGAGDEFNGNSAVFAAPANKIATRLEPIVYLPGREDGLGYFATWAQANGIEVREGTNAPAASSRGSGRILAPVTGEYEFVLGGGFGRLKVNNTEVSSEFRTTESNPTRVKINLTAGQTYPIVYERFGYAPGGTQITWAVTGQFGRTKIPTSQLFPN